MVIASVVRLSRGERWARGWCANELRKYNASGYCIRGAECDVGAGHHCQPEVGAGASFTLSPTTATLSGLIGEAR